MATTILSNGTIDTNPKESVDHQRRLSIVLKAQKFIVGGHPFLLDVPPNIVATPSTFPQAGKVVDKAGCFVGFESVEPKSRHVEPLGRLMGIRFMSIFTFRIWWTTHWVGNNGSDIEPETQMVMLDRSADGRPYVLMLPLIEGPFRASLQAGQDEYVDMCIESGSTQVSGSSFRSCLYMHAGDDPYDLVRDAMKVLRVHLNTFRLLEEKSPPGIVDKFGWCTWNAFYLNVHPEGVWEGVKGLVDGGVPPGLIIMDDGWQSTCHDDDPADQENMTRTVEGEQISCRLRKFQENYKMKDYQSKVPSAGGGVHINGWPGESPVKGMGAFIRDLKSSFKTVEYVYVWHALCAYWGGIKPNVPGMPDSTVLVPTISPGLEMSMEDLALSKLIKNGVGLVPPEMVHQMYEGLHSHMASLGIDGVKVDVIHQLEMLGEDYGGRVELAKAYFKAMSSSVNKHFKGNGVIASMEQSNDFMFLGTEAISLGRVGDDFWCTDASDVWLQGCHMVHCAYNSLWMGNFFHPDWDMFQSTHPCARFHAASRAISGGPVYVSDTVGKHDFQLLKSLVLPDGTILRCDFYALPTRDCLFEDPLLDGKTMLKIWNLNKYNGVLGAFNCQGGGWCRKARKTKCYAEHSHAVTSTTNANEIEWNKGRNPFPIDGVESFAIYFFQTKKLVLVKPDENIEIILEAFDFELLTVSPVKILQKKMVQFAPIGLVNMLNTGGAVQSLEVDEEESLIRVGVRGTGEMRAFSSEKPKACRINGEEVGFVYEEQMVVIQVPWPESSKLSVIEYLF